MEQTENTQTPTSPVNNVQNPHFSRKKLAVGIVLILVLATVLVLGMGYGVKSNKISDIEKSPVQTVTNDMEGWKTYSNSEYGISFKYPSNWLVTFYQGNIFGIKILGDTQKQDTELYDGASFHVLLPIAINEDIKTWVKKEYSDNRADSEGLLEFSEVILNGVEYEKVYTCGLGCVTYFNTIHNGLLYRIFITSEGPNKIIYQKTLDQILSTLKFTDIESENNFSRTKKGYIKDIYEEQLGVWYLSFDEIGGHLSGEEAIEKAIKETGCIRENIKNGDCAPSLNNGYYISNQDKVFEVYNISDSVVTTVGYTVALDSTKEAVDINTFKGYYKNRFVDTLFSIEIENDEIVEISEVYVP